MKTLRLLLAIPFFCIGLAMFIVSSFIAGKVLDDMLNNELQ